MKQSIVICLLLGHICIYAQEKDSVNTYKKRVLDTPEVSFLSSYYQQEGNNSAVGGGIGTEYLTNVTPTVVVSIPLNADDVLTIDAGISAYSSASSSNINPFDGRRGDSSPFQASSGESQSDALTSFNINYSHSSDDRNKIWSVHGAVATEYDYSSIGFGGSYSRLFNQKNTEISLNANVYLDKWQAIYPIELQAHFNGGAAGEDDDGIEQFEFRNYTIAGNSQYNPVFEPFDNERRNSYSLGLTLTQILSRNIQGGIMFDLIRQEGLLSTPYQRVYFSDVEDSFIENFQLADAVENLPGNRMKMAIGGRLNFYINERVTLRSYYRYYGDDWGLSAHTVNLTVPIKVGNKLTLYPSYRFYRQHALDYFAPHEAHLSTEEYYTSDFDLSDFDSNQYGFGIGYTDIFTKFRLWKAGLKEINLRYNQYHRSTGLSASIISAEIKFIID